ncbi:glycoside hydrolase [Mucilaginibacter paludis]|uniref:Beta-glycosidase n=1 Tax=Mucilaginibacter paludis DSM 18603 TaxID=714943 RepID=H1Y8K2_9SPHI|nr:glycoside hydrolase [Mucilaginibacter paludis]EHQ25920.1 beta-glycosidase [Mucilaginibacter paludis DSM 18603]
MTNNKITNLRWLLVILILVGATSNVIAQKPPVKKSITSDTVFNVTIDLNKIAQTIENIGASGCWYSEWIGKYWPAAKKEKIAELLFSRSFDKQGNPAGIGLSAWRFNIGAGTFEQGDTSGIKDFAKRTESFLDKNGTYDWNKQTGYQFFLKKAHQYGVNTLIAFSNSPPVQFTKNGLGYKTERDFKANLKEDSYQHYARFLANVMKHFDKQGIHFQYISPVNEPQWDWSNKYMHGSQEGSPWKNEDIYKITRLLNNELDNAHLGSEILLTEAGMLTYLYGGKTGASHQIQDFFNAKSHLYLGALSHVPKIIGGHSYYTESNDSSLVATRKNLADTADKYHVKYWQSEYSMLADGYKEGAQGKVSAMDCALFLAKIIHTDLSVGNATAWQFWNAYEPGSAKYDTRYYLIALKPKPDFKNGDFVITKNLWAIGSYSRFVRPGMKRIITTVSNHGNHGKLMLTSYIDDKGGLVIVGINYGMADAPINLAIKNPKRAYQTLSRYLTAGADGLDMKTSGIQPYHKQITLPARSISTIVIN